MAEGILHKDLSQRVLRDVLDDNLNDSGGMPERSVQLTPVGKRRGRLPRTIQEVLDEALEK
ncbi:hypothetical protein EPO14_03315 [Patescibacteria group bacterium]|nr:MAG: hypothetical protein EPO14_03315 [Patescibacteria group bacterium]